MNRNKFKFWTLALVALTFSFAMGSCKVKQKARTAATYVTSVRIVSITVSAASASITNPASQQYSATALYSDGVTKDITSTASWISEKPYIATVNDDQTKGLVLTVSHGSSNISAILDGVIGSKALTVTASTLSRLEVYPTNPSLALVVTPTTKFKAFAFFTDGTKSEVTQYATWTSGTTGTAVVEANGSNAGLTSNIAAGTTAITASLSGKTASSTLTLTSATVSTGTLKMEAFPFQSQRAVGDITPYQGIMYLSDSTVQEITADTTWTTGATTATISNDATYIGQATASSTTTGVTVLPSYSGTTYTSSNLIIETATLTRIMISPKNPEVAVGLGMNLKAYGVYTKGTQIFYHDLTHQVEWSSPDSNIATICNALACKGLVSPTHYPSNITRTVAISANLPNSAIIGYANLNVRSHLETLNEIQIIAPSVNTTSQTPTIKAIGRFSSPVGAFSQDITKHVNWSSSDTAKVIVSNDPDNPGLVKQIATGSATITATLGRVSSTFTWTGLNGYSLSSIQVFPVDPSSVIGVNSQFTAIATYSNGSTTYNLDVTDQALWASGTVATARISNAKGTRGKAYTLAAGTAVVTATFEGVTSGNSTLTVDAGTFTSLHISPLVKPFPKGLQQPLKAVALFTLSTTQTLLVDVTDQANWSTSEATVATVDSGEIQPGLFTALGTGNVTITASFTHDPTTPSTILSNTRSTLVEAFTFGGINLHPASGSSTGYMNQYYMEAYYTDSNSNGYSFDVTDLSTYWGEDFSATATGNLRNDLGYRGRNTVSSTSNFYVKGQYATKRTSVVASPASSISSLAISPTTSQVPLWSNVKLSAIATFANGTTQDVTEMVNWTSSNTANVIVSNQDLHKGTLYPIATAGTATITATLGTLSATASVTEPNTAPTSVALNNTTIYCLHGDEAQLTYTATYAGGTADITEDVTWTSSSETAAQVDNSPGKSGHIRCQETGSATITGTWVSKVGTMPTAPTATITHVTSISSLAHSTNLTGVVLAVNKTSQLSVNATTSTPITYDATTNARWTSSNPEIASVSNRVGTKGFVVAHSAGITTVTATYGGKTLHFSVSVQ